MPLEIEVKSILNKTKRRDPWFLDDYTINPYSGCSFNCLFCYIRGSKYGTHMEDKLSIKTNAPELLEKQLHARARKNQHGVIVMSSATEPYLQFEKELKLTRSLLEIVLKYKFPVHIITRSDLVQRDFDLLEQIDTEAILPKEVKTQIDRGIFITFSFSTLDDQVAKIFEPGAVSPTKRLVAHDAALKAGFHSGISLMPMLPYITDTAENLNLLFGEFSSVGSRYIFPATLTLFGEDRHDSKTLVLRAVKENFPDILDKYERFFSQSTQMPAYYRNAFHSKMQELCKQFGLKNRI